MSQTNPILPADNHNQALLANVRPSDWTNPEPAGRYQLVVIGAGTAGLVTAAGAAGLGAKVALVEREFMGGDCLNFGCVPSKALLRAARACAEVRDASRFGIEIKDFRIDFPAIMERLRRLRAEISPHDSARRFRDLGVDVFFGEARFTGADTLEVTANSRSQAPAWERGPASSRSQAPAWERGPASSRSQAPAWERGPASSRSQAPAWEREGGTLRFRQAVIATGGRAARPDIPGLADAGFFTNETIFSLTALPARLAVVGAGPIGCELAQAFARFGARVTLINNKKQVLPREDPDAAALVQAALQRDGVQHLAESKLIRVELRGGEKVLHVEHEGQSREIAVDAILLAVGRVPNVDGLNLEAVSVAYDAKEGVHVNDRLRTSNPRIFAAGDICSRFKFTHAADAMARIAIQNALFPLIKSRASALTMPWCTYTDPEVAHVGLYEHEARQSGIPVQTFSQPMADVDRAILDGDTDGFVRIHIRQGSDKILGATIVARHAGEMISEVTLAMTAGIGLGTIARTIHPYPTQAEAVKKLGDAYNRGRFTGLTRWLLQRWLAWTR